MVNDTPGHAVGDAVPEHAGSVLKTVLADAGLSARFGRDEFVVAIDRAPAAAALAETTRRIASGIRAPVR